MMMILLEQLVSNKLVVYNIGSDIKASRPKFWPRPQQRGLSLGLGLVVMVSFNITVLWSRVAEATDLCQGDKMVT
jgi:hypothetical protein